MQNFSFGPISQIPTTFDNVYAFKLSGHLDDDAAEALAKYMNDAFDHHDKLNMLMDLTDFSGSDWDSMLDGDVIRSRLRSLTKVEKYAVVGASDRAEKMIGIMDKIIPVDAKAFEPKEMQSAWHFVGGQAA